MSLLNIVNQNGSVNIQPRNDIKVKSLETTTFQLTAAPANGDILLCDADGNATWTAISTSSIVTSATAPVTFSTGTTGLAINSTNLRVNANFLDTIQNIRTVSSPSFTTVNLAGTLATLPPSGDVVTTAFGTSITPGTAKQNTLGYDILVNVCYQITPTATCNLVCGTGPSATPLTDTIVQGFSSADIWCFPVYLPKDYYLLVNHGGAATGVTVTCTANAI